VYLQVDYFGAMTPLKQVASITVPDSTTLQLTPFDPSAMKDIERAINVRW
jgi:ribosome recycling factor